MQRLTMEAIPRLRGLSEEVKVHEHPSTSPPNCPNPDPYRDEARENSLWPRPNMTSVCLTFGDAPMLAIPRLLRVVPAL